MSESDATPGQGSEADPPEVGIAAPDAQDMLRRTMDIRSEQDRMENRLRNALRKSDKRLLGSDVKLKHAHAHELLQRSIVIRADLDRMEAKLREALRGAGQPLPPAAPPAVLEPFE